MTKTTTPQKKTKKATVANKVEENTAPVVPKDATQAASMVMTPSEFKSKFIAPIGVTGKKLRELVHNAAYQSILLVYASNQTNYDFLNQLQTAVLNNLSASDSKKLIQWIMTYSPTRYVKTKDGYTFRKNTKDDSPDFDFEQAFANPYHTLGDSPKDELDKLLSISNLGTAFENLIKRYEKALEDGKVKKDDRASIENILETMRAIPINVPSNDETAKKEEKAA